MNRNDGQFSAYEDAFWVLELALHSPTIMDLSLYETLLLRLEREGVADVVTAMASVGVALGSAFAQLQGLPEREIFQQGLEEAPFIAGEGDSEGVDESVIVTGAAIMAAGFHCATGSISEEDLKILINSYVKDVGVKSVVDGVMGTTYSFIYALNCATEDSSLGVRAYYNVKSNIQQSLIGDVS